MTLGDRIATAARAGAEGEAWVRERSNGRIHRVVLRGGRVVAAHVAGRFDPILAELVRIGALGEEAYWEVLEALATSERRSGDLAVEIGGAAMEAVRAAVAAQLKRRVDAAIAASAAATGFAPRVVPPKDGVGSFGAIEMIRGSPRARSARATATATATATAPVTATDARRRLRQLARELHPDRHAAADPAVRAAFAARLARATAAFHGF